MVGFSKGLVSSVGYSFAMAALCSLAIAPQAALADDEGVEKDASRSTSAASSAQTGKRVYSAPVAKEKNETVYVFANPDGSVKSTEVSTTLKNPLGEPEIADTSTLTDIDNAESDSTYSGEGDGMVWYAEGQDVYYTGKTDTVAPVSVKVTYFLDGKKTTYDKLAGATGKLKIRYDYENTATVKARIADKDETLYVPFTFITALMFDNDNFKNAEVTNGKLIDDGDRAIVAGYAIPGLQKSLGSLVDDFDIPDYFEVTADVTDFEMKTSLTIATAGLLEDFDADDIDTSELEDASKDLTEAMDEILDGTGELKEGLDKLAAGAANAKVAAGKLADGSDKLADGASALSDGISTMKESTDEMPDGIKALADGSSALATGTQDVSAAIGTKDDTAADKTLLGGMNSLKSGYDKELLNPVKNAVSQVESLLDSNEVNIAVAWEALRNMDKALDALDSSIADLGTADKSDLAATKAKLAKTRGALDGAQDAIAEAEGAIALLQKLDLSSVETGLTGVGANMAKAGEDLEAAGGMLDGSDPKVAKDLQAVGADAQAAGESLKSVKETMTSASSALESYVAEITPKLSDKGKARMAEVMPKVQEYLGSLTKDLTAAGDSLEKIEADLGAAQTDLGTLGGYIKDAGDELTQGGKTLAAVGDTLSALKGQLPDEAKVAEMQAILATAKGALTDENVEIMDQCIEELAAAMDKLDIDELNGEIALLKNYYPPVKKYLQDTDAATAVDTLKGKLDKTVTGMETVSAGMKSEQEGLEKLAEGASALEDGAGKLDGGLSKLNKSVPDLVKGVDALDEGAGTLAKGADTLAEGAGKFDKGLGALAEGADAAAEGTGSLLEGLQEFDDEGISKISDLIDDDILPFKDRLEAISDAAKNYNNFGGITDGTAGSVKFIIETDPITLDD